MPVTSAGIVEDTARRRDASNNIHRTVIGGRTMDDGVDPMDGSDQRSDGGLADRGGTSRRTLLKQAAAGTAIVWATPAIFSTAAHALGSSCQQPQTFTWTNNTPTGGTGALVNANAGNSVTAGTAVNVRLDLPAGGSIVNRQTNDGVVGGTGNNFILEKSGAATGASIVLTITFSLPVLGLTFSLLDVDKDTVEHSRFTDRITVAALTTSTPPSPRPRPPRGPP